MKVKYIPALHRALQSARPDGWNVQAVRDGRSLFTVATCEDRDYFQAWAIADIMQRYGFDTRYA